MSMITPTPPKRGLIFEERVRRFLSAALSKEFSKKTIPIKQTDKPGEYICDLVSSDATVIGAVKDYTWRKGKDFPNRKFEELQGDLVRLQLALVPAQSPAVKCQGVREAL